MTWKFDKDSKSDIVLYLKCLTGPQKSNFLFRTDLNNFFSLTWKFDGVSKSDIVFYLKRLNGPQKVVIMIRCKINFVIMWYSVIFAANLYLSIFVLSSDIFMFSFSFLLRIWKLLMAKHLFKYVLYERRIRCNTSFDSSHFYDCLICWAELLFFINPIAMGLNNGIKCFKPRGRVS